MRSSARTANSILTFVLDVEGVVDGAVGEDLGGVLTVGAVRRQPQPQGDHRMPGGGGGSRGRGSGGDRLRLARNDIDLK